MLQRPNKFRGVCPFARRRLSGGELFNRIVDRGSFPEDEAKRLFSQILLSMEYLHNMNIVHRDVKPENILYVSPGSNDIKLIDFGYAGIWAKDKPLTGLCGTPDYVAPEVLTWYDDDDAGTPYGKGSDMWSMGEARPSSWDDPFARLALSAYIISHVLCNPPCRVQSHVVRGPP